MKTCTKCKTEYPATTEFFPKAKFRKDKLRSWCRRCYRKVIKNHQNEHQRKYQKEYRNTIIGCLRQVFYNLNGRCNNPDYRSYKDYGGRGIKNKFEFIDEFVDYVINELQIDPRGLEIDRIDNDGHYEKGNIRFVTHRENCNNRRNSVKA